MQEIFFYGLFMDQDLLRKKGLNPVNPRKGYVAGLGLRVGRRATLLQAPGERAYGMVMRLADDEARVLYSEESVSDYIAQPVTVTLTNGRQLQAVCYNLPARLLKGSNPAYAQSLLQVAVKYGLPQDYIDVIKQFSSEHDPGNRA